MTPKTHKIFTPGGTVTTRTPRRYIVVEFAAKTWVARTTEFFYPVAKGTDRAEVEARAIAEVARREIGGEVVVEERAAYARVAKRTDAYEVARREAAKVAGGMIFDAERGAGI